MAAVYDTYGPFRLQRNGARVAKDALKSFWRSILADHPGLCDAVGIYIFAVKAKKRSASKPWYIGRTDRMGFQKRLAGHELRFRDVLERAKNGQLEIYFIALKTPRLEKFRKPTKSKIGANDWLESMMIGSALSRNPELINAKKVKNLRTLIVPGFLNNKQGKLSAPAASLKRTLGSE